MLVFAGWFVGPMASVMFFDLVFWDDTLSPDEVVGQTLDGTRYVSHGDEGYEKRQVYELSDPELVFEPPVELTSAS